QTHHPQANTPSRHKRDSSVSSTPSRNRHQSPMLSLQAGPIPLLSSGGHFQHQQLAGQQPTTLDSEI
ncbi:hypothetical protein BGZ59_005812, partial [Podila verticillata]